MHTGFWWGNLRERDHLEEPGIHGRIILEQIFGKWDGKYRLDWSDSIQGQVMRSCKHGNEPSDSIKCREFLD